MCVRESRVRITTFFKIKCLYLLVQATICWLDRFETRRLKEHPHIVLLCVCLFVKVCISLGGHSGTVMWDLYGTLNPTYKSQY